MFVKLSSSSSGYRGHCKECHRKIQKSIVDRDKVLQTSKERKWNLNKCYGISVEEYNKLFTLQEGKCKICSIHQSSLKRALFVDHCHITRKIRGLLCPHCNSLLGHAKDNISTLNKAIDYLEKLNDY